MKIMGYGEFTKLRQHQLLELAGQGVYLADTKKGVAFARVTVEEIMIPIEKKEVLTLKERK